MSKVTTPPAADAAAALAAQPLARYTALQPIEHDGVRTEPPGALELTEAQAAPLLALRHIEPALPAIADAS